MLYYAFGFFVAGLFAVLLDLTGVAVGAAGLANFGFLLALVFLAAKAVSMGHHHTHHYRRHDHFQPHY